MLQSLIQKSPRGKKALHYFVLKLDKNVPNFLITNIKREETILIWYKITLSTGW